MSDQAAYDVETILLRLKEIVETGRSMPMSASVLVNREEFIELLDESIATLPQELRHARWLLKEREQFLSQARREADDIIEAGRVRAERMVERTEVVREARRVAQNVIDEAEAAGRQLRHEAEDYVDQKLAAFEVVLERTMQAVQKGRQRLQVVIEPDLLPGDDLGELPPEPDFEEPDHDRERERERDREPESQQSYPQFEEPEGAFFDQDASY